MSLTRRQLFKATAIAGAGLTIGFQLTGCQSIPYPAKKSGAFQPNAFLQITADNQLILQIHKSEMGQGVTTGFATLIAEELNTPPGNIRLEFAKPHPDFNDPQTNMMMTGGSNSISSHHMNVRQAGAAMREMLIGAAASLWQVPGTQCKAHDRQIINGDSGRSASFAELIPLASKLPVPESPSLVSAANYRYIGKVSERLDARVKTTGEALFAMDIDLPGILNAVVVRCPQCKGKAVSYNASEVLKRPGIKAVLEIQAGIAIVADSYWQARNAVHSLEVSWDPGELSGLDTATIDEKYRQQLLLDKSSVDDVASEDKIPGARSLSAEYSVPFLAHATMEPQNAVVDVTDKHCDIWAPNQSPDAVRGFAAHTLNRSKESITVHSTWLGGGFGRRSVTDYVSEAVEISQKLSRPIRLIWSREDDMRHDLYRPACLSSFSASITPDASIKQWTNRIVGPSVLKHAVEEFGNVFAPAWIPQFVISTASGYIEKNDTTSSEGASHLPYSFADINVKYIPCDTGIRVGYWRSVGHSYNGFTVESFVDELAHTLKEDPVSFRARHLTSQPRHLNVLKMAADKADWHNYRQGENGRYLGVAVHESFGTQVAQVTEVSVNGKQIKVHKVICAVDCGEIINPDIVKAQMEGSIIFALTAALKGKITIKDGAIVESNFHDYPMMRIDEAPDIEVYLVDSDKAPSGVGEPGVPPAAPALANAVFAATGQRLRQLPLVLA